MIPIEIPTKEAWDNKDFSYEPPSRSTLIVVRRVKLSTFCRIGAGYVDLNQAEWARIAEAYSRQYIELV